ncbi:MAG: asparagine synthase (glutamine-hydrolyzing) [Cytophagales bacterium]|nr:MAG: asparagine synthase (glutamine-hydrolyzing) [Cytophagales bacterium]TAF61543.1 MAG: asparagine synthase (glutamine-hydrolyzing) [Cytophagales bacterium]
MCGILGSWGWADVPIFENALAKLAHRGPDGQGFWQQEDPRIMLGHRRLSILDTSALADQPMRYGGRVIVFNGEIYNFLEIKQELLKKGYAFLTESDTEVVLAAYDAWGSACLQRFNGMWALAIWDIKKQELFISRDRFGKKPIFYTYAQGALIFASEMKALMPFMNSPKPHQHFERFSGRLMEYENEEDCLIEGIKRFPAGSFAQIRLADLKSQKLFASKFWYPLEHLPRVASSYPEQVEEFRELFMSAVRLRMRADVPVGTALSGGIDSSAVACAMHHIATKIGDQKLAKSWQKAFVGTFEGTILDETHYAKAVVDKIGAEATYISMDPAKGIENLQEYLYYFEELYLTSPIPMIEVYKAISKAGVKVSIDGHGADELLSGYGHTLHALKDCGLSTDYIKHILELNGIKDYSLGKYFKVLVDLCGGRLGFGSFLFQKLFGLHRDNPASRELGYFNQALFVIYNQTILPTLLRNYDRYAMAASVEIRMPFLDYRLASYCFALPWQSKIPLGRPYTKSIIRDALGDLMPDLVRYRATKVGFNTPILEWMKGGWRTFLLDTAHSKDFLHCSLVKGEDTKHALETFLSNPNASYYEAERIWASMMPYFWQKAMFKSN